MFANMQVNPNSRGKEIESFAAQKSVGEGAFGGDGDVRRKLLFFKGDAPEVELEVDEGKEEREQDVEAQTNRFAAIVVLEQIFAHFEDDDDPEQPGEEEARSEGCNCPIEGQRSRNNLANPDAEVEWPRGDDEIEEQLADGRMDKLQYKSFCAGDRDKQKDPMNRRRRRIGILQSQCRLNRSSFHEGRVSSRFHLARR